MLSAVWDGCTNLDKLEKEQLYAARIVTGLHILAAKASLYFEIRSLDHQDSSTYHRIVLTNCSLNFGC